MKRFLIFTLLVICLIGCAEESENPLTSEETTDPNIPTIVGNRPRYTHRQRCFGRDSMPHTESGLGTDRDT